MATFEDFEDLVVCDKCRDDIGSWQQFVVIEKQGKVETFHKRCAPAEPRTRSHSIEWLPKPL